MRVKKIKEAPETDAEGNEIWGWSGIILGVVLYLVWIAAWVIAMVQKH